MPTDLIPLVTLDDEPRVDSRLIADQLGIDHINVRELIQDYQTDFEEFGKPRFETEAIGKTNQPQKFVLLNEDQSYLLLTYVKNTAQARELKKRLVRSFSQCRQAVLDDATPREPVTIRRDDELDTYELEFESFLIRVKINGAGESWFHLHDVCRVLGYTDVRAAQLKYCTNRATSQRARTLGGVRYQNFGAIGTIFRLAAHSTSTRAGDFERWMVDTALPTLKIRSGVRLDPAGELKALLQQPDIAAYVQQLLPNAAPADASSDEPAALTRPADEPEWRRILHVITEEIDQGHYPFPYDYRLFNGEKCLLIRPAHIMEYLENAPHLADFHASLYLQSDRILKRELHRNQALLALRIDPVIGGCRLAHAVAIDLAALRP